MISLLTKEQMRLTDGFSINELGIPSLILMENAARSAFIEIKKILDSTNILHPNILIICGSGNNGGDGFALSRHLINEYDVTLMWLGDELKMSEETKINYNSSKKILNHHIKLDKSEELVELDFNGFNVIIDSMIGVGGSENIQGMALDILKKIKDVSCLKIAIDIPTGLNSNTGKANPDTFMADYTITMFAIKTGMVINDGLKYCGKIIAAELGSPNWVIENFADTYILEEKDIRHQLPARKRNTSKFNYGRVCVIAGSETYSGAAALASNSAILSGAGLVELYSTNFHNALLPEIITHKVESNDDGSISSKIIDLILKDINKFDVFLIGCGLGSNSETINSISLIIKSIPSSKKIIIDADGLRVIKPDMELNKNIILTPHSGEFSNLTGIDRLEVENNSLPLSNEWATKLNCIITLKTFPVIISNGKKNFINISGNPGMATAGSGDVLAGLIAGLSAQIKDSLFAAAIGVLLHSKSGDNYKMEYSEETLTASSILNNLKDIFIGI